MWLNERKYAYIQCIFNASKNYDISDICFYSRDKKNYASFLQILSLVLCIVYKGCSYKFVQYKCFKPLIVLLIHLYFAYYMYKNLYIEPYLKLNFYKSLKIPYLAEMNLFDIWTSVMIFIHSSIWYIYIYIYI